MKKIALVLALIIVLSGCGGVGNKEVTPKVDSKMQEKKVDEPKEEVKDDKKEEVKEDKKEETKEDKKEEVKEEVKEDVKEDKKEESKADEKPSAEALTEEAVDLSGAFLEPGVSSEGRNEDNKKNAIELNRWVRVGKYSTQSKNDEEVFLRITKVTPQSEDAEALNKRLAIHNELFKGFGGYDLSDLKLPEDVELCLVEYDLYIPKNFPSGENGIAEPYISLYATAIKGGGIPSNDGASSYVGLGSVNKLQYEDEFKDRRGQVYHGYAFFAMVKGYKDYVLEYSSNPIGQSSDKSSGLVYHFFKPY